MSQLQFDDNVARQLEKMYASRDAVRRRGLVREALAVAPGERVLDVGCGPGFYLAELVPTVGAKGSLVGVDMSPAMLEIAAAKTAQHPNVELREGSALQIPVDDGDFDAALCVQVLEYVEDATAAIAEIRRTLRPGGRVVLWDVDWATLSWHSADPARMQRMLQVWDEHLTHPSLPQTLASRMREAGFVDVTCTPHPFAGIEFDAEVYLVSLLGVIADFARGRDGVDAAEVEAWVAEQGELGERGEFYASVTQFCFTGRNPD
ncbi:MAG TPA: methyltransferase domain-containing protein [Mycobacteriales bacterium]|nr:methyltransferase domain-containing protein [Mycobacteriales bacterium]